MVVRPHLLPGQIAEEEALLAVTLFPRIREVDISCNPLTVCKSGNYSSSNDGVINRYLTWMMIKPPACLLLQVIHLY